MANDYTTSTDAFADISEGGYSSSDSPVMATFVTVASRMIDAELGRWPGFFYPSTADETRYYDGNGEQELPIDEFVSITSVSVSEQGGVASSDYTAWTSTDYYVAPYNYSSNGKPINRLVVDVVNGSKPCWYGYRKAVQVVGVPGYVKSSTDGSWTPPDLIVQATKTQALRWFLRAKQGWQDVGGNDELGKRYYKGSTELDPDVKLMLWPIKLELDR